MQCSWTKTVLRFASYAFPCNFMDCFCQLEYCLSGRYTLIYYLLGPSSDYFELSTFHVFTAFLLYIHHKAVSFKETNFCVDS